MAAYYLKAWHLWRVQMRRFDVEYSNGTGSPHQASLTDSWP